MHFKKYMFLAFFWIVPASAETVVGFVDKELNFECVATAYTVQIKVTSAHDIEFYNEAMPDNEAQRTCRDFNAIIEKARVQKKKLEFRTTEPNFFSSLKWADPNLPSTVRSKLVKSGKFSCEFSDSSLQPALIKPASCGESIYVGPVTCTDEFDLKISTIVACPQNGSEKPDATACFTETRKMTDSNLNPKARTAQ